MNKFPASMHKKLNHYIYVYIDPRDNKIFYIGKGQKNRAFDHLDDKDGIRSIVKRIEEIKDEGLEPKIEILIHGIENDETAKKIESSLIDIIGIENLTNTQKGYESRTYGRMSLEYITALHSAEKVAIEVPALLFTISKTFRYGISDIELYDATRSAWRLDAKEKEKAQYAFAVYRGIVQEVYIIEGWHPENSTFNTRKKEPDDTKTERWEFVGRIADQDTRKKYRYRDVSEYVGQNPIRYMNIKNEE